MSSLRVTSLRGRTAGVSPTLPDGAVVTGVATATTFDGNVTGNISGGTVAGSTGTFTGDVDIADKIIHTGDTNTAIRFPAADTFTVETGGSERTRVDSSGRLLVGTSSDVSPASFNNRIQVNTNSYTASILLRRDSADDGAGNVVFAKSRSGSLGSHTIVQSGDDLGKIIFYGADGTDTNTPAATIEAAVDGTPGSNDMPGRLTFSTTADGASSVTERLRITSDAYVRLASGTGGIQFNGDTAAANALDDYEEGTWTPTVTASGGTITTATASGDYTKIGNIVRFQLTITISNVGSATGTLISTLPFNPSSANWAASGAEDAAAGYTCIVFGNGTNVLIRKYDYTTAIVNGHRLKITGTFQV